MKDGKSTEKYIPTRDLKVGIRVVGNIGGSIYRESEPILKRYVQMKANEVLNILKF